jgi:hypothetical protein
MVLGLVTSDLTEKTSVSDNDEFLIFDSDDIEGVSGLPYWKILKASNIAAYTTNIASRIFLEMTVF